MVAGRTADAWGTGGGEAVFKSDYSCNAFVIVSSIDHLCAVFYFRSKNLDHRALTGSYDHHFCYYGLVIGVACHFTVKRSSGRIA